jgi:tetratricopeptide (TPR) repeat protein
MTERGGRFGRLEFRDRGEQRSTNERSESRVSARRTVSSTDDLTQQQSLGSGNAIRTPAHHLQAAGEAYRSGRFDAALQLYTRALQGNRALVPAWVGQVQMLVELGEYVEARLWSDKALELVKGNGELLAAKARACVRDGDDAAALACSDASMRTNGTSPLRWQARGEAMLARNGERARDCFEKSILEPTADWFDRIVVARIYIFHGRPTPAVEFAQTALKLEPGHWFSWMVLGKAQEALGWSREAEASYERAHSLPGGRVEADSALTALRAKSGAATFVVRLRGAMKGLFRR